MSSPTDNPPIVAVETSGSCGSVAVGMGDEILGSERFDARNNHGVELLPTVDRLTRRHGIAPAEIAQVYVSGGPGSFTGLRIGVTFAKALAHASGAKVVRVPTLTVIAQNALDLPQPPARVAAILDAKRKNVFAASFALQDQAYVPMDEPDERDPADYLASLGEVAVLGEGVARHAEVLKRLPNVTVLADELHEARAAIVYQLGREQAARGDFIAQNELAPSYIRRPEAEERWEERQGA
ncbi:MAG: tRNA (adenosine(37)-N6)-threonylcarbamoyltransferase complex dimerization subunit type 1 TsaB [Phycisphaerales bacterium]|nr:tRNA (adenosine(37)-N6)-threonylcarbamoyltransferase complex dimerization subunit type 1 TsaB [Phycisphaerales bacterium]